MSTVFHKYAAALLPFFVLVIGASQTVLHAGWDATIDVPFAILVAGAVLTYIAPLADSVWQGRIKTGIAIFTTVASAVVPFFLPGGFQLNSNLPIIIVAVLNALSTEFGVQIRTAPTDTPATGKKAPAKPSVG